MVLQYKKIGPWKDYLFGERMYIVLSLLAKTALAWQIWLVLSGSHRPYFINFENLTRFNENAGAFYL